MQIVSIGDAMDYGNSTWTYISFKVEDISNGNKPTTSNYMQTSYKL